jgi:hypothetical protein
MSLGLGLIFLIYEFVFIDQGLGEGYLFPLFLCGKKN